MPLYAGELNLRRGAGLEEYPASLGQVLGAQADDTRLNNPVSAIGRMNALSEAERGPFIGNRVNEFGATVPQFRAPERLDAATARQRIKDENLPLTVPDEGIAAPALEILIQRKREELQRQSVFARGPSGVVPGALRLGTALVNSLYDPLNIASAFIPVVGQGRYAAMLAGAAGSFGRAGVRAGVGAVEGVVGAALLEPIIYSANQQEQADYGMADSLANIAFGGLFGGGLHAGGGAVRDLVQPGWWRMATPASEPTRLPADSPILRALDAQPSVREPVRAASAVDALPVAQRIADAEQRPGFQRTAEDLIALKSQRSPEIDRAVEILKQPAFERAAEDRVFLTALEKGREGDYVNDRIGQTLRQIESTDQQFLARGNSADTEAATAIKAPLVAQLERDVARLTELGRTINEARLVMERVSPETRAAALRAAVVQAVEGRQTSVDALVGADPAARLRASLDARQAAPDVRVAAEQAARPDAIRSAEPRSSVASEKASREAKPASLEAAQGELDEAMTAADDFAAALGESDRVSAGLKDYDAAIKRAEDYAKALRAGAACGLA